MKIEWNQIFSSKRKVDNVKRSENFGPIKILC